VLIQGETGTGKELVARALHRQSRRSTEPMLYLNCAALPESLAESELFGHRKGSFTSAERNRTGKFELADGGTLFLDEVGELPLSIQAKLLRAIQEGEIQPVGSEKVIHTNVRLIAATNRDLTREVEEGRFRRDLFHRLNVYPITVPPLHDHLEDIPLLAGLFIERTQKQLGIPALRINEGALALLQQYNWPGNVRELENIISRAALKASLTHRGDGLIYVDSSHLAGDISPANLPEEPVERISAEPAATTQPAKRRLSLREETKKYQIKLIEEAVRNNDGNWAAAARDLSMNRSNLHNLAGRLGLAKTSR
ncbi:MAG: sigma 54-interacting transcriptional regulator, partial [Desulforhopalus sp.]|nr:sigma 54-interacting transcriptional regulator [Desulforhopalus sp.]